MEYNKIKSVKTFLKVLRDIAEQGITSDLKGSNILTEAEHSDIASAVAALQNELGDLEEIYKKLNLEPYKG